MSQRTSEQDHIFADWQAKRDKANADQQREQAENQRRSERRRAYYALLDSESDLKTELKRHPSWPEWARAYADRLCAWVALWDERELEALEHLPPLSQREEELHPGMTQARDLAICLTSHARQDKKSEVRDLLNQLRDDHLDDAQGRESIRKLRRLVLIWLHYRLADAITESQEGLSTSGEPEGQVNPASAEPHEEEPSERQRWILQTMLEQEIASERRRKTRAAVVQLINRQHKPQSYNRDFAALVNCGCLRSREGSGGGVWLTPEGKAVAQRLRSSS